MRIDGVVVLGPLSAGWQTLGSRRIFTSRNPVLLLLVRLLGEAERGAN